jgi:hypothetical protein
VLAGAGSGGMGVASYRATAGLSPRPAGRGLRVDGSRTSGQVPAPLRGAGEFLFARSPGARPLRGLHPRLPASAPSALPPPAAVGRNGRGPSGAARSRAVEAGERAAPLGTGGLRFARRAGYLLAPLRGADPAVQGASPSRSSLQRREKFLGPDARSTDERAEGPARNVIVVGNREGSRMARFDEDDVAALLASDLPTELLEGGNDHARAQQGDRGRHLTP